MGFSNQPNYTSDEYNSFFERVTFMRDVVSGQDAINAKSTKYLPKYNRESDADYKDRLANSEFLESTKEATQNITGKLLFNKTTLEDINDVFNIDNIDNAGTTFEVFEHSLTKASIRDGIGFILVDYPRVEGVKTVADKKRLNAKPYFIKVDPLSILNYRTSVIRNETKLSQVTIEMSETIDAGEFGDEVVTRYKVYRLDRDIVTLFTYEVIDGETILIDEAIIRGVSEIPLVPFYTNELDFYNSSSILKNMAHLNIKWYRLNSALNRSIERACDPTPVLKGQLQLDENGEKQDLSVGSSQILLLDYESNFEWVGASSDIIQPTKEEIKDTERRMSAIATQILVGEIEKTATQSNIDNSNTEAKLMTLATNRENCLNKAYKFYCDFAGVEAVGQIKVNRDFSNIGFEPQEIEQLRKDYLSGIITKETYIKERQRASGLTTVEDIEKEIVLAEEQQNLDNVETFNEVE